MGWSIGYDDNWDRDIGYGVPAICDHPNCNEEIHRGLAYVCGEDVYGGDEGCGLFFCPKHQLGQHQRCERCARDNQPFTPKADAPAWIRHKLSDPSWALWRSENRAAVRKLRKDMADQDNAEKTDLSIKDKNDH